MPLHLIGHDATVVTGQVIFPVRRVCSQEDVVRVALELWGYQEAQSRVNTPISQKQFNVQIHMKKISGNVTQHPKFHSKK